MSSNRIHRFLGMNTIMVVLVSLSLQGCFIFSFFPSGKLSRYTQRVVLRNDVPAYYAIDEKGSPGKKIGALSSHTGDTLTTLGYYSGDIWESTTYFLIKVEGQEVYIDRHDALTADDQIMRRLRIPFSLTHKEDEYAWRRAMDYIKSSSSPPIEIASDVLIKTSSVSDSTSISYLVMRVVLSDSVEYEIICKSFLPRFDADTEARHMAFYMVTGRRY